MNDALSNDSKRKDQVILDVFLDNSTHESFLQYCRRNTFDLSTGFIKATERGMRFFRAAYYKELKQNYLLVKRQAEEYENDNKALKQLEEENQTLRQILNAHKCKSKGIRIET
jgi:cell shape-determining protein MreC